MLKSKYTIPDTNNCSWRPAVGGQRLAGSGWRAAVGGQRSVGSGYAIGDTILDIFRHVQLCVTSTWFLLTPYVCR